MHCFTMLNCLGRGDKQKLSFTSAMALRPAKSAGTEIGEAVVSYTTKLPPKGFKHKKKQGVLHVLNWLKRIVLAAIGLLIIAVMAVYFTLRQVPIHATVRRTYSSPEHSGPRDYKRY